MEDQQQFHAQNISQKHTTQTSKQILLTEQTELAPSSQGQPSQAALIQYLRSLPPEERQQLFLGIDAQTSTAKVLQTESGVQGGRPQQHKQPSPQPPTTAQYQASRTQPQQQAASTTQVQPGFVQQNIAAYEENLKQKMELMKLQDQASSHHNILNPQSPDYMNPQEESQYPEPEFQSPVSCVGHKQELIEQQQWEQQQWLQQQDELRRQEHLNASTESPMTSNDVNNYSVSQHTRTHVVVHSSIASQSQRFCPLSLSHPFSYKVLLIPLIANFQITSDIAF